MAPRGTDHLRTRGQAATTRFARLRPTMLSGSVQDNILPQHARAVINYRIHLCDPRSAVEWVENVIDDRRSLWKST